MPIVLVMAQILICLLIHIVFQDDIIINLGIRQYRIISIASIIITVIFCILYIYSVISNKISRNNEKKRLNAEREAIQNENSKKEAVLSVKDKLNRKELTKILYDLNGEWRELDEEIDKCIAQMNEIHILKQKLHDLLIKNGATTLMDTEEVVNKVEQYICNNARKIINYLYVADSSSNEDIENIKGKINKALSQNEEQIDKVQEFLYAMTDYLNSQGDSDNDINMLEIYKNTILKSINEG